MQTTDLLVVDSLTPTLVGGGDMRPHAQAAEPTLAVIKKNLKKWETRYRASTSTATRRAVRADWQVFFAWCERNGRRALPVAPEDLLMFLQDMVVLGKRRSTLNRYVSTIRLVHGGAQLADPTLFPEWKLEWRALVKHLAERGANAPKQAEPLTSDQVKTILASLGESPIDLRDAALISLASDTLCRESELVRLQKEDFKASGRNFSVDLRDNKTDQEGLGSSRFCSAATKARIDAWCACAGIAKGHIFLAIGRKKRPIASAKPIRAPEVARIFRRRAVAAGVESGSAVTGHSTRVGSAVELLEFGQPVTAVQFAGGWKSPRMVLHYGKRALAGQNAMAELRDSRPLDEESLPEKRSLTD